MYILCIGATLCLSPSASVRSVQTADRERLPHLPLVLSATVLGPTIRFALLDFAQPCHPSPYQTGAWNMFLDLVRFPAAVFKTAETNKKLEAAGEDSGGSDRGAGSGSQLRVLSQKYIC